MLGFISDKLDRQMENRDDSFLESYISDPDARVILFNNCDPVFDLSQKPEILFPLSVLNNFPSISGQTDRRVFLGKYDGKPVFALNLSSSLLGSFMERPEIESFYLRKAAIDALVSPEEYTLLGYAHSLIRWHEQTRYCCTCGTDLKSVRGGIRQDCPQCTAQFFPRIDPVVIMLVYRQDHCLLGSNRNFETGRFSCLAGFMESGESVEAAVRREVMEEAGVTVGNVFYHTSQPWPLPNQIMIGCFAEALDDTIALHDDELVSARWFSREDARRLLNGELKGFSGPPEIAIAWHLINAFANKQ